MSRIGRMPVVIPANVTVTIADGNVVTVKGPLGTLTETFTTVLTIKQEGAEIIVTRPDDEKETRSLHGLTRALLNNMVVGGITAPAGCIKIGARRRWLQGCKAGQEPDALPGSLPGERSAPGQPDRC